MDYKPNNQWKQVQYKRLIKSREIAYNYTGHAVVNCCKRIKSANLKLRLNVDGQAYYDGLIKCHSVWDCPHCSGIIAKNRRHEIGLAITQWRLMGGKVKLITYTVRHNKNDKLKDVKEIVNEGYRFSKSGAPYQRLKENYKIEGSIVTNEINYSDVFGWHYHRHEIVFYKSELDFKGFEEVIYKRYYKYLSNNGFSALPGIGVNVSEKEGDLSDYLTKWGLENEITSNKESYSKTPFQLLDNEEDLELFIEYSRVMLGKRRITWSRGLKDVFNLKDLSDEEVIENENDPGDEIVTIITKKQWDIILSRYLYLEVLDVASDPRMDFYSWWVDNVLSFDT